MKRLYQQEKFRRFNTSRSNKEMRRREDRNKTGKRSVSRPFMIDGYGYCPAPSVFSLIENPEEVLSFFQEVGSYFRSRRRVYFDFSKVVRVTPEAIAFLVAHIKDNKFTKLVHYRGNNPDAEDCAKVFDESGFFRFVRSDTPKPNSDTSGEFFHETTRNKVEPQIAKEIAKGAIDFSLTNKGIFSPLYEVLVECMANTNNHASPDHQGFHNWWSFCYRDKKTRVSHFCFIDLGVGILRSLPVRKYRLSFNLVSVGDSVIFDDILKGKVKSRTGEPDRGKGLPLVHEHAQDPKFKEFYILTNRTFANLKSGHIDQLRKDFKGTLVYWELHEPSSPAKKSLQPVQMELAL